jgi:cytochrome P450
MKTFTFSNGVTIPKGTLVAVPVMGVHHDETLYENPHEFDGFRFSRMLEEGGASAKYYATNISEEYLVFGNGAHAWFVSFIILLILVPVGFLLSMRSS